MKYQITVTVECELAVTADVIRDEIAHAIEDWRDRERIPNHVDVGDVAKADSVKQRQLTTTIEIRSGCEYVLRQAPGTTLIIRDYDTQQGDEKKDKDGDEYAERKYVERRKR